MDNVLDNIYSIFFTLAACMIPLFWASVFAWLVVTVWCKIAAKVAKAKHAFRS